MLLGVGFSIGFRLLSVERIDPGIVPCQLLFVGLTLLLVRLGLLFELRDLVRVLLGFRFGSRCPAGILKPLLDLDQAGSFCFQGIPGCVKLSGCLDDVRFGFQRRDRFAGFGGRGCLRLPAKRSAIRRIRPLSIVDQEAPC